MGCVKMEIPIPSDDIGIFFRTSDILLYYLIIFIYIIYHLRETFPEKFPEKFPQKSDFFSFQCRRAAFRNLHSHKITYPMRTPVENHYTILLGASEKLVA